MTITKIGAIAVSGDGANGQELLAIIYHNIDKRTPEIYLTNKCGMEEIEKLLTELTTPEITATIKNG